MINAAVLKFDFESQQSFVVAEGPQAAENHILSIHTFSVSVAYLSFRAHCKIKPKYLSLIFLFVVGHGMLSLSEINE